MLTQNQPRQIKIKARAALHLWKTLKVIASHSPSVAQLGGFDLELVQIQTQLSTPQTYIIGRKNMHVVCVMGGTEGVDTDRQQWRPKLGRGN